MVGAILANPEKFHAKAKLFGILFVFCFVFSIRLHIDFSDKRFLDIRRALSRTSNSAADTPTRRYRVPPGCGFAALCLCGEFPLSAPSSPRND
jgi:hypothetical protein